jgi:type II secretory pathway component GspD/PulD (secretin)
MTLCFQQLEEAKKNLPQAIDYEEKVRNLKAAIDILDDDTATIEQKNRLLKAIIKKIDYVSDKNQPRGTNDFKLRIDLNI